MSAGKYQAYPKYTESNIAWLGKVPDHWTPLRFKHALFEKPKTSNPELAAGSISFGEVVYKHTETLSAETKNSYQEVLPGEFLVNPLNLNFDLKSLRTALSSIAVVVSTGYLVLKSSDRLVKRYVRWLLQEFDVAHMKTLGSGVRQTINYTDIGNSFFYEPPPDEQTQIAKFLDYETAKIDALIAKQQQLIALLQEKRQAVISHAVTKGLNPAAPLRDSGVAWLGKVPAHWEVSRLGYLAVVGNGSTPNRSIPEYWAENDAEGVGWLNSTKINDGKILAVEQFISQRAVRECHLPLCEPDSVLVAITGEGQTRGRAALLKISATINQHLAYLLPDRRRVDANFLWRQLQARYSWLRFESAGGGSTRAALTCEFLRGVPITLPPLVEQNEIVKWLDTELTRLDSIVDMAQLSMDLLQERRTALIAAAVTGKIDVRGWQPPVANAEGVTP